MSKVPEVTLIFWIIKVAATTLGETAGAQIAATRFRPTLYWTALIATTTLADFADRSLVPQRPASRRH